MRVLSGMLMLIDLFLVTNSSLVLDNKSEILWLKIINFYIFPSLVLLTLRWCRRKYTGNQSTLCIVRCVCTGNQSTLCIVRCVCTGNQSTLCIVRCVCTGNQSTLCIVRCVCTGNQSTLCIVRCVCTGNQSTLCIVRCVCTGRWKIRIFVGFDKFAPVFVMCCLVLLYKAGNVYPWNITVYLCNKSLYKLSL